MSGDQYGAAQGFVVPPMPSAPPPAPPDGPRAVAVGVLNLSGLGLGYALVGRRVLMVVCWAATALLLLVALPADADGVPGVALALYAVFLVLAAVHGAFIGLRTRLAWPARSSLALPLGLLLLVVPAGGVVLYDGARDEAVEQMLLDRLERADRLVLGAKEQAFSVAQRDYRRALGVYDNLSSDHAGSRAADRVPDRLKTFYTTVATSYDQQEYCVAIAPLKYLRTVPRTIDKRPLGDLATWPDDRLATSLYECASDALAADSDTDWTTYFGDLLTTFPQSAQAAKVEPAVKAAVAEAAKDVHGAEPCAAVERLEGLASRITSLPGERAGVAAALTEDAGRATGSAASGTYNCGIDQYKDGDFDAALATMKDFIADNDHDGNRSMARKVAIAAEVAQTVPAAGKRLPTNASGGSITVTVKNDSPEEITVLYTGPVTGSFKLAGCGSCTTYSFGITAISGFEPCSSGTNYPQKTISLPPGTTYFVHRPDSGSAKYPASDTAKLRSGYIYTECAYTTTSLFGG